jgi:hypothetical protein
MMTPGFPKFGPPQVAVVHVETWTGILLTLDGRRFVGTGETCLLFPTFAEAETYARQKVREDPQVDCVLFDHAGVQVAEVRPAWVSDFKAERPVLRQLSEEYKALTLDEERGPRGESLRTRYWAIVDRMVDQGLSEPLPEDELIDGDFWSDKYRAFVHRHLMATDREYRFARWFFERLGRISDWLTRARHTF